MVATSGADHIGCVARQVCRRFLNQDEVVVGCAVLRAGCCGADGWRRKHHQISPTGGRNARNGASIIAWRDSARLPRFVAWLHRTELARLLNLLHVRQSSLGSADCCRFRRVLFCTERGLAVIAISDVVRAAYAALRMLQRGKCLVDRTHWREPSLLRLGLCCEHPSGRNSEDERRGMAVAIGVFHDHRRGLRLLHFTSLFSFSLVDQISGYLFYLLKIQGDSNAVYENHTLIEQILVSDFGGSKAPKSFEGTDEFERLGRMN